MLCGYRERIFEKLCRRFVFPFSAVYFPASSGLVPRIRRWRQLGADPRGNLIRIENALDRIPDRLKAVQAQLENYIQQQAAAQEELGKPFPQEQELKEKTARLVELDMELNLDGRFDTQPEQVMEKAPRESVLEKLRSFSVPEPNNKQAHNRCAGEER